tara:strand:- start:316 stop:573 length:258 start_codon:yes stop_codon:yes gene_type:complete
MGCPCKNPPGQSAKKTIIVRNPRSLKPVAPDAPVSRDDIRNGRTRRISEDVNADEKTTPERRQSYRRSRLPMGGFLSDTIRNQRT